jgi:hypothetical protein
MVSELCQEAVSHQLRRPSLEEPILLPDGRTLGTLGDAINWLSKEVPA